MEFRHWSARGGKAVASSKAAARHCLIARMPFARQGDSLAFPYHDRIGKEAPMAHFRIGYPYLAHPRVFKALEEINGTEQVANG